MDWEVRWLAERQDITSDIRRNMVFWVPLVVRSLVIFWRTKSRTMVGIPPVAMDMALIIITITIITDIVEAAAGATRDMVTMIFEKGI